MGVVDTNTFHWLLKRLLPKGRAFNVPSPTLIGDYYTTATGEVYTDESGSPYTTESFVVKGGVLWRLLTAFAKNINIARGTGYNVLEARLPDNEGFTLQDAHDWYRRLGMYDSGSVSFADMKAAITQKLSFPAVELGVQSPEFIQEQLRAAGFDVYVYRNHFSDGSGGFKTLRPSEVLGIPTGQAYLNNFYLGQLNLNATYADAGITLVANYLEEEKDADFVIGDNYNATFFIAGSSVNVFAEVPIDRKIEFRQLIHQLKRLETVGFLFVNYV